MERRRFLVHGSTQAVILTIGVAALPTHAIGPPALVQIARVFFTVAFERYLVRPILSQLARWFPRLFASELRKYLIAVAVGLGIEHAQAMAISGQAEDTGAVDLARNGYIRLVDLTIRNDSNQHLELVGVQLALVDVNRYVTEMRSMSRWGIVVSQGETLRLKIECDRFRTPGLKRWYVIQDNLTLAVSEPFLVIA